MTRLLVSVRNAAEAEEALQGGADLIDVKDPGAGSLGAAAPRAVAEVLEIVAGRVDVSAALGELGHDDAVDRAAAAPTGLRYAKFGLAALATANWASRWRDAIARLPRGARPVAVVYADWQSAAAPSPHDVLAAARRAECPFLLIDTFDKSRGRLTEIWPHDELARFAVEVKNAGPRLVVAGSLQLADLAALEGLSAAFYAVRGAVCCGAREGALDGARVRQWSDRLALSKSREGTKSGISAWPVSALDMAARGAEYSRGPKGQSRETN